MIMHFSYFYDWLSRSEYVQWASLWLYLSLLWSIQFVADKIWSWVTELIFFPLVGPKPWWKADSRELRLVTVCWRRKLMLCNWNLEAFWRRLLRQNNWWEKLWKRLHFHWLKLNLQVVATWIRLDNCYHIYLLITTWKIIFSLFISIQLIKIDLSRLEDFIS